MAGRLEIAAALCRAPAWHARCTLGGDIATVPPRPRGRPRDEVSILGLGGHHLGLVKSVTEAVRITPAAIDAGINFLDNAW